MREEILELPEFKNLSEIREEEAKGEEEELREEDMEASNSKGNQAKPNESLMEGYEILLNNLAPIPR